MEADIDKMSIGDTEAIDIKANLAVMLAPPKQINSIGKAPAAGNTDGQARHAIY